MALFRIVDGPRQATAFFGIFTYTPGGQPALQSTELAKDGQIAAFSSMSAAFSPIIQDRRVIDPAQCKSCGENIFKRHAPSRPPVNWAEWEEVTSWIYSKS